MHARDDSNAYGLAASPQVTLPRSPIGAAAGYAELEALLRPGPNRHGVSGKAGNRRAARSKAASYFRGAAASGNIPLRP